MSISRPNMTFYIEGDGDKFKITIRDRDERQYVTFKPRYSTLTGAQSACLKLVDSALVDAGEFGIPGE